MAINNELTSIDEKEDETLVAELQPLSATDQATSTFSGDTSVPTEDTGPPTGRFQGQGGQGTTSRVDLSDKANSDQMWREYEQWKSIGRSPNPRWSLLKTGSIWEKDPALTQQREAAKELWYQKYYGMSPTQYENLKDEQSAQYEGLSGLDNTFRNLTDISMGTTTDFVMDAVGVLPGLGALDSWYDRKIWRLFTECC